MLTNAGTLDDAGAGGLTVFETAQVRWLNVEEIIGLLSPNQTASSPLQLSTAAPSSPPPSGTLLLYDRSAVRSYKADGHTWIKKRNNPNKIREDHVKLRFQGQYRISGTYVHCALVSTMHRRAYRLIGVDSTEASMFAEQQGITSDVDLVLVHYLDTLEAVRVSALYADHLSAAASKNRKKVKGSSKEGSRASPSSGSSSSAARNQNQNQNRPPPAILAPAPAQFQSATYAYESQAETMSDDEDDAVHRDHILAAIGAHHGREESLDEGALDILWDMVLEEGAESDRLDDRRDVATSDVQNAAAMAIEQHLTPAMEAQLVNTVEAGIQDVATSKLNEHMAAVSDDDIRQVVEQVLNETELVPTMEEKLVSILEDRLPDQLQQKLVDTMKNELEDDNDMNDYNEGAGQAASASGEDNETNQEVVFARTHINAPLPIEHGGRIPQTPLPEIIDFTPSEAVIRPGKPIYTVISTSAGIPMLPPDDLPYRWHIVAAFIDIGKVAEFVPVRGDQDSSTETSRTPSPPQAFSPDPLIMKVALADIRKLTPFSYKCMVPEDIMNTGRRAIILVGVRYIDADVGPLWDAIRVAVKVCIQAEWNVASDMNTAKAAMGGDLVRPKFYAPAGSGNVQLLSQLSQELFEILEVPAVSMTPAFAQSTAPLSIGGQSQSSEMSTSNMPAPASTMATVASALTQLHENPPQKALGSTISGRGHKRALSVDDPGQIRAANESAADWMTSVLPDSDGTTRGEVVDRHCKIRFVERLANVIVGTEDGAQNSSTTEGGSTLAEASAGSIASAGYKDPGLLLSGGSQKLKNIDDDELESLLNSVLIRFVESMVDSCANEDELKEALNQRGFSGFTLLHYAALYNILSLIPLLLSRGADPNIASEQGNLTPLHLASGAGHDQIVDALVRSGSAIDVEDSFGLTPADHANRAGFIEISDWLLDKEKGGGNGSPVARCSPKNIPGDKKWTMDHGEKDAMMQSAFKELSLKDKLGLNLFVQRYKQGDDSDADDEKVVPDVDFDEGSAASNDDVDFKFISEKDRESLKVAMSLMSKEELEELEVNAPYSNVREWMLRSNYESLRDASIQLEKQAKRKVISNRTCDDSTSGSHSGSGSQTRSSKKFSHTKLSQVLAMLVLRKNLLGDSEKGEGEKNEEMKSAET